MVTRYFHGAGKAPVWFGLTWFFSAFMLWSVCRPCAAQTREKPTDAHVKSAYLYAFGKFIEWPLSSSQEQSPNFIVGIMGDDPIGEVLSQVISGKTVKNKQVVIRRPSNAREAAQCHILFIGASQRRVLSDILDGLRGFPVLTVGDMPQFIEEGGAINFILVKDKVHFQINNRAAVEAGIKISSQLLKLAK